MCFFFVFYEKVHIPKLLRTIFKKRRVIRKKIFALFTFLSDRMEKVGIYFLYVKKVIVFRVSGVKILKNEKITSFLGGGGAKNK
jgi:hypothetical protein